jgi:hypothetical protein
MRDMHRGHGEVAEMLLGDRPDLVLSLGAEPFAEFDVGAAHRDIAVAHAAS